MLKQKKPTLPPWQCDHCKRIWYGGVHRDQWVPEGYSLCLSCWSELDNFLYRTVRDNYNLSWAYMKTENIPIVHAKAREWIADATQKPHQPKNIYYGGGVPAWMRSAIDKGLVETNADVVYIVTVDEAEQAVSVETSQDRSLLKKGRRKQYW
jgi:hypothetical protein